MRDNLPSKEPPNTLEIANGYGNIRTPANRERQLCDEPKSCGTQPAYISMIIRRYKIALLQ